MKITNGKILIDKTFVDGGICFDEKISCLGPEVTGAGDLDAEGCYIIPGLIDIHTHGAMNEDASNGSVDGLKKMAPYYAGDGVTSWLPTTMTLKEPELTRAMESFRDYVRPENGAKIIGVNMEGPFVSYAKRGAQNADNLHAPDVDMFRRLNAISGGMVKIITVAPEEPGCIDFILQVADEVTVSIGHTVADVDTAALAYSSGACHTTHLFNAMPALAHRAPGVIGAASDASATAELICDGFHIHPSAVRLAHRLFGDKLVLVSDSGQCAGMPDGDYMLGDQPITLKSGKACLRGTDTLSCSSVHLMEAVRRAVKFGISLEDAVYAASAAPAGVIHMEDRLGSLKEGLCADIVILDKDLQVKAVFVDGQQIR